MKLALNVYLTVLCTNEDSNPPSKRLKYQMGVLEREEHLVVGSGIKFLTFQMSNTCPYIGLGFLAFDSNSCNT